MIRFMVSFSFCTIDICWTFLLLIPNPSAFSNPTSLYDRVFYCKILTKDTATLGDQRNAKSWCCQGDVSSGRSELEVPLTFLTLPLPQLFRYVVVRSFDAGSYLVGKACRLFSAVGYRPQSRIGVHLGHSSFVFLFHVLKLIRIQRHDIWNDNRFWSYFARCGWVRKLSETDGVVCLSSRDDTLWFSRVQSAVYGHAAEISMPYTRSRFGGPQFHGRIYPQRKVFLKYSLSFFVFSFRFCM